MNPLGVIITGVMAVPRTALTVDTDGLMAESTYTKVFAVDAVAELL